MILDLHSTGLAQIITLKIDIVRCSVRWTAFLLPLFSCLLVSNPASADEVFAAQTPADEHPQALPIGDPARRDQVVELEIDTLLDTASGRTLVPSELPSRLQRTRLLLVGESHTSDEFHRVQEVVIRELHRAGRTVVIGLEMMPTEAQAALDRWSAGELSEEAFLEASQWYENWGYHWEYYRPIFQLARREGLSMRGLNVPRELVRAAREKGFDGLGDADRRRLPPEIQPPTEDFRRLFLSYFDDESGMHGLEGEMLEGFLRSQTAWDASMAFAAAGILGEERYAADPTAIVVVLVGSGHVAYGLGIERQAAPLVDGEITTLIPVSVAEKNDPEDDIEAAADDSEAIEPVVAEPSRVADADAEMSGFGVRSGGREASEDPASSGAASKSSEHSVSASYADILWGVAEERWPRFPSLGLSTRAGEEGARQVLFVADGSAAERAGVEAGDELLAIDGQAVDGAQRIRQVMGQKQWGDTVELRWRRGDDERSATAYLRRTP